LFPGRRAILVTVWEAGMMLQPMGAEALGTVAIPPDPAAVEAVDHMQHDHATRVSGEGAELARSLGLNAEAHAVVDQVDVADTLLDLAREWGAAAIVVGSHGRSGLRSHLVGGVSRKLIRHSELPVVVTRDDASP
jgi:nucleotide-binding universal stress UspA family protein